VNAAGRDGEVGGCASARLSVGWSVPGQHHGQPFTSCPREPARCVEVARPAASCSRMSRPSGGRTESPTSGAPRCRSRADVRSAQVRDRGPACGCAAAVRPAAPSVRPRSRPPGPVPAFPPQPHRLGQGPQPQRRGRSARSRRVRSGGGFPRRSANLQRGSRELDAHQQFCDANGLWPSFITR